MQRPDSQSSPSHFLASRRPEGRLPVYIPCWHRRPTGASLRKYIAIIFPNIRLTSEPSPTAGISGASAFQYLQLSLSRRISIPNFDIIGIFFQLNLQGGNTVGE